MIVSQSSADSESELDRMVGDLLAKICSHAAINEAMQDSWNDICSDTGCHPLDIEQAKGKVLTFNPNHWANQIAKRLFVRALKLRLETAPQPVSAAQTLRKLFWLETFTDRGDGSKDQDGWEADSGFGSWYSIEQYFGSDSLGWQVKFEYDVIADHDDPDKAKESAQADFERRVLALPSTNSNTEAG
jgi:hypothetical protein